MPAYGWFALVVLFGVGIAVAQWRGWIELRGTGRGHSTGSGAFGALDEVFAPTRHEAQRELQQQTELPAPAPVAGDPPFDLDNGRVRIRVDAAVPASRGEAGTADSAQNQPNSTGR